MLGLKNRNLLNWITLTFSFIWLVVIHFLNEIPLDVGDGIMHLNISQASWSDTELFIHHWGKPLFILLSSTFAQFGMDGMVFFNIIVFVLTVILGWKILSYFSISILFQSAFPLILISVFDYTNSVLAGLTEPIFSLFIMLSLWLMISKKWIWFAIIVSLTPFLRSEGQLVIVLGFCTLLLVKEFKSIPFLALGFVLYGILGKYLIDDFWWYFTNNPYEMDNGIYGHGNWYDYLASFKQYIGNVGLILMITGCVSIFSLVKKKEWMRLQLLPLLYVSGIFFGIIFIHSYFWANGLSGSLGLTRIATQGMPPFILLAIYYTSKVELLPMINKLRNLFFLLLIILIPISLLRSSHFPSKAKGLEKEVINAANFLKSQNLKGKKMFFHHPLFAYEMGGNSFIANQPLIIYYCNGLDIDLGASIKPGDFIIRDSHFGPQEARMKLEEFENSKHLIKVKTFISNLQVEDPYNEVEGVTVYQYAPKK
ncbi:hypothetical protein N9E20_00160 [Crocinitomicaceae bacterium]|nr:hypothetical protein [Crocinitomicaceae bacterium]